MTFVNKDTKGRGVVRNYVGMRARKYLIITSYFLGYITNYQFVHTTLP